jgi:hypothetical protein
VNTSVSYDVSTGQRSTWGFLCDPDDERYEYQSLFKLFLDPNYVDDSEYAPSVTEAQTWYRDYLSSLYEYISDRLDSRDQRFRQKHIE